MTSTSDAEANWRSVRQLVEKAAGLGARFIATPENTNYLGPHERKVQLAESLDGPTCLRFTELARRLGVHLLLGSFNEESGDPDRCYNTSVLFGPDGEQLAVYRKIHLFDIDLSADVRFKESDTVAPGDELVVASTGLAVFGLSICYDLRFSELYGQLAAAGAQVLTVPSAFTLRTGKDHWHPLLRTRALENQCWVVAPAQCGSHDDGGLRESFGHAMIVDPWGHIVAMAADGPGLAVAEIDLERLREIRAAMPVNDHRRL
jgi:predicted amidohydrolase